MIFKLLAANTVIQTGRIHVFRQWIIYIPAVEFLAGHAESTSGAKRGRAFKYVTNVFAHSASPRLARGKILFIYIYIYMKRDSIRGGGGRSSYPKYILNTTISRREPSRSADCSTVTPGQSTFYFSHSGEIRGDVATGGAARTICLRVEADILSRDGRYTYR